MSLPERVIGFVVEHEQDQTEHVETTRLVVIDKRENERFIRNIVEAFADRDKKLEDSKPKIVEAARAGL